MVNLRQNFGRRLKELRKLKGITQEKFAEMIDITPRNLSKIETGQTFPSTENLEKIICKLDCKPHILFNFSSFDDKQIAKKEIINKIDALSSDKINFLNKLLEII